MSSERRNTSTRSDSRVRPYALPLAELKDVVGVGLDTHPGEAGGLNITTRQVETIANDGTSQPVPGHRHHR